MTQDPRYPNDPANWRVQLGEIQSKGLEFDVVGEVVEGLNVTLNYAYTDPKVTKDESVIKNLKGTYVANAAKHITNGWLSYSFKKQGALLNGFGLSGGYQFQFERVAGSGFTKSNLPDYLRFDAGLSYAKGKFSLSAVVNNLFDRKLFTQGTAPANTSGYYTWIYEMPRNARITALYKFK
ncbi:Ferrichrome-iron receptor precursor [compost metagenome]